MSYTPYLSTGLSHGIAWSYISMVKVVEQILWVIDVLH